MQTTAITTPRSCGRPPAEASAKAGESAANYSQPWLAVTLVILFTLAFAFLQNRLGFTGGPISTAKTLWLSYALQIFLVVPLCLWRCKTYSPAVRRIYGAVFLSFAIRGVIELYLLYFTRAWECIYGISHDLFTFALVVTLLGMESRLQPAGCTHSIRPPDRLKPGLHTFALSPDRRALLFVPILLATLLVECFMAWQFSQLASPNDGIYFAADTEYFRRLNLWSWIAVGIGYPALGWFLWITRKDFYELETSHRQNSSQR